MDLIYDNWKVLHGSCLDRLKELPDNSVDSVVTDPPYELGFMNKGWDSSGIAFNLDVWRECLRVLKPGGHLLAFGGTRTYHRMAVAIEDAGFEIRDSIAWLYGSGFPKSQNISKALDKSLGAEVKTGKAFKVAGEYGNRDLRDPEAQGESREEMRHTAQTDEAKQWEGWGTALKPAFEPIVVGRKPLSEKTIAQNVLTHGTGGINIDGSRIEAPDQQKLEKNWDRTQSVAAQEGRNAMSGGLNTIDLSDYKAQGRWPANIILDEYTAELLDEQSGISGGGTVRKIARSRSGFMLSGSEDNVQEANAPDNYGDKGGASRFFYVAKASKKDRNEGLDEVVGKEIGGKGNGLGRICSICGAPQMKPCGCEGATFVNPVRQNFHPTVKPTQLMRYLVKLVTPPNGIVLDPFTGSGSTGKAAILEGFKFVGVELTEDYLPIIKGRLAHAENSVKEKLL